MLKRLVFIGINEHIYLNNATASGIMKKWLSDPHIFVISVRILIIESRPAYIKVLTIQNQFNTLLKFVASVALGLWCQRFFVRRLRIF